MEMIWFLIALTLSPDKEVPQDLTGETTVTYHQRLNECRKEATESHQRGDQRIKERLKEHGMDETVFKDIYRKGGIVDMAICWNSKEAQAQLVYPKQMDGPWLGVVTRFTPISYVDKNTGKRHKFGMGISRVGRFKSLRECREQLADASTELARLLKPEEEKTVFCLSTGQG